MGLLLSDEKAQELIKALKHIVKRHVIDLNQSFKGTINLKGFGNHELDIHYLISRNIPGKYSIHLMDCKTYHTLIRLNICNDNTFHKNADGERIYGNRVNIFSTEEYEQKNDGQTHYKAYNLPYDTLVLHPSFHNMLNTFLEYTNTVKNDKLTISSTDVQMELF
ncbi:DUF6978 family protein [Gracilibacillus alcaliphilus]|uniref:DUF6978 family protein n=1 Tax=Gracilibacillus alcaliphilus TaxID=1401441 RepID=UPI00195EE900|nr:hypothetical protein [Gracilibacillus alcaliphilus]MBM7678926.1 hypothetical protein [Gracilibacillus alcaliphilus]